MSEFSNQRPEKVNFGMSQDAFEVPKEDGRHYHYKLEFLKGGLILAEMDAVFDHSISREELVAFLKGYQEIKDERYDVRCLPPTVISEMRFKEMRERLVTNRGGIYQMTEATAKAQEEKDMEALAKSMLDKKLHDTGKRKRFGVKGISN